jgi:hypothetical protein
VPELRAGTGESFHDEFDEFFLATLVDHGDDEEAAGPSRRGGSVRGRRFVMRDQGWYHSVRQVL